MGSGKKVLGILQEYIRSFSSNYGLFCWFFFLNRHLVSVSVLLHLDSDLPFGRRPRTLAVTLGGIAVCLMHGPLTFHQKPHLCRMWLSSSVRVLRGVLVQSDQYWTSRFQQEILILAGALDEIIPG